MARLYCEVHSDRGNVHKVANEKLELEVFYGSKEDSRKCLSVVVSYRKGATKPKIEVTPKWI